MAELCEGGGGGEGFRLARSGTDRQRRETADGAWLKIKGVTRCQNFLLGHILITSSI